MGGRRKHRKHAGPAASPAATNTNTGGGQPDSPTRLFALQKDVLAVAFGTALRAHDLRTGKLTVLSGPEAAREGHAATIRALAFDPAGRYLIAGDDAKVCRVWDLTTGGCVQSMILHKKVSAVAASADGCWALAADKFGDVYAAPLLPDQPEDKSAPAGNIDSRAEPEVTAPATAPSETAASGAQARSGRTGDGQTASAPAQAGPGHGVKAAVLLSHYNATVTSLTVSADGSSLVSTDRDGKARVSVFPSRPLQGANEIRSYCLGHTQFVSCSAFISRGDVSLLATGSGDGSVRLWDPAAGRLAETLQLTEPTASSLEAADAADQPSEDLMDGSVAVVTTDSGATADKAADDDPGEADAAQQAQEADRTGGDDEGQPLSGGVTHPAVLAVAVSPTGRTIAAAVEGEDEVVLLHAALRRGRNCGLPKGVLGVAQRLALPDVRQPFAVAFQPDGRLWAAGVPATPNADNRGMVLGAADRVNGDAADAHQPEEYAACVSDVLSLDARTALEVCGSSAASDGTVSQIGGHMKRKAYSGARGLNKRFCT